MEYENLLKKKETVTKADGMEIILKSAVAQEVAVEVRLDREETAFHTHFLDLRTSGGWQDGTLLLSPLEPMVGNIRIRTCSQLRLRFALGIHLLEGKVGYIGQEKIGNTPCLRLMDPAVLGILSRRRLFRHPVTTEASCRVVVSSRRAGEKEGDLIDLHEEGMGFWNVPHGTPFQTEEYVRITCTPQVEGLVPFTATGIIRYMISERRPDLPFLSRERCGVAFQQFGEYLLFKKFLDHLRQVSPDPATTKKRSR